MDKCLNGVNTAMGMRDQEERLKERVYTHFDNKLAETSKVAERSLQYALSGAYDDHDRFLAYSQANKDQQQDTATRKEYLAVYSSPYFAHMGLRNEDGKLEHVMLSDCADLDHVIDVGRGSYLVPFKQSKKRPMLTMLFHEYQNCRAESFTVKHDIEYSQKPYEEQFTVELIRNVEINQRQIMGITQLVPVLEVDDETELPTIDELLLRRLEENRSDAKLRNIIATLQREQFDIIRYDIDKSFIVQGCAGSGKTQCLIHRLFFLRDSVGEMGWDKVLLITPSQLFRNYSMDLMRRYHLTGVSNYSLSSLYVALLQAYDPRFKNRQYEFELTEEYLPDQYLSQVYTSENIIAIRNEISRAISEHVLNGFSLLGIDPPKQPISAELITSLGEQIEARIAEFDENAAIYEKNPEYKSNLDRLDAIDKRRDALQKRLESLEENKNEIASRKERFHALQFEIQRAEEELAEWKKSSSSEVENRQLRFRQFIQRFDTIANPPVKMQLQYGEELSSFVSVVEPYGRKYKLDRENEEFLRQICELAKTDLAEFLNGQTERAWLHRLGDRESNNTRQTEAVLVELQEIAEEADSISAWLQDYTKKGTDIESQRKTYRAALERSRYFLGRIESSIFEREVWAALEPMKTACGVVTVKTEHLENGHERQTRILYKSDLLFYLMVYEALHGNKGIPDYRFICIDEGQDLHAADYQLIHRLYPDAELNIFGDTAQVLHEACGISNWPEETGISKVFELNNNYRNAPEIVAFCNKEFNSKMQSFGKLNPTNSPKELRSIKEIKREIETNNPVVIVKSREEYKELCLATGLSPELFEFLDMNSDQETPGKLHCYSIFAAKGLEFPSVLVYTANMSKNQKTVACTRALERLYTCD